MTELYRRYKGANGAGPLKARQRAKEMEWRGSLWVLALVTWFATPGCLFVPYTPEADVYHSDIVIQDPESVTLTTWPQDFLEKMGDEIVTRNSQIEIVPAAEFRDAVFPDPDGSSTLAALLAPTTADRIEATQTHYLIALSYPRKQEIIDNDATLGDRENWGGSVGYVGGSYKVSLSAAIIDLDTCSTTDVILSKSDGPSQFVTAGIFAVGVIALSERSTNRALAKEVAATLRNMEPNGTTRVVLLTAHGWNAFDDLSAGASEAGSERGMSDADD